MAPLVQKEQMVEEVMAPLVQKEQMVEEVEEEGEVLMKMDWIELLLNWILETRLYLYYCYYQEDCLLYLH